MRKEQEYLDNLRKAIVYFRDGMSKDTFETLMFDLMMLEIYLNVPRDPKKQSTV